MPAPDATATTDPPRARMRGKNACSRRNVPCTLMSCVRSHVSMESSVSFTGSGKTPAHWIRISMLGNKRPTASRIASTCTAEHTSAVNARATTPSASSSRARSNTHPSLSARQTDTPCRANAPAMWKPMPLAFPAPITNAVLPFKSVYITCIPCCGPDGSGGRRPPGPGSGEFPKT